MVGGSGGVLMAKTLWFDGAVVVSLGHTHTLYLYIWIC